MLLFEIDLIFVVVFVVSICVIFFIFLLNIERFLDFFLLFYVIICVFWNLVIWSVIRFVMV